VPRVCTETLEFQVNDMPFNLSAKPIVILKDLPVFRCENCGKYAIEDPVMEKFGFLIGE
jgi:YgiT-type zinc finger domain-containing protein